MNHRLINVLSWGFLLIAAAGLLYYSSGGVGDGQKQLRLSAAGKGGYYYEFGSIIVDQLDIDSGYDAILMESKGSVHNSQQLIANKADLAIVQTSAVASSLSKLSVVAPLWHDYVHIVVRKGRGIKSIKDLVGKKVALGGSGSGHRASAARVLPYYGIELTQLRENTASYRNLVKDKSIDAALVTTTLANPVISGAMATGDFELIPLPEVDGFGFHNSDYEATAIPAGVYPVGSNPQPEKEIRTLRSLAVLACRKDLGESEVAAALNVLYSIETRTQAPILLNKKVGTQGIWHSLPIHETSKRFFDPLKSVSSIAATAENIIDASKFLLFFVLVIVAIIVRWVLLLRQKRFIREKEESDSLQQVFSDLLQIEAKSRRAKDIRLLKEYLHEAQQLKGKGVMVIFGSSLKETAMFSAFLLEANQVVTQLEYKLLHGSDIQHTQPQPESQSSSDSDSDSEAGTSS
ncbi:MAG: TAXI family TRAP transporter solute-binding subunit [Gammaproteobacteria bacterium]|nr:TAXI family TRAP transporter solute-binding subunit [Gammaproteobacteria bacterium]